MNRQQKIVVVAGLSALATFFVATTAHAAWRLRASARLARDSHPFARVAAREGARLLVVGDSTAEGTGASEPARGVPGLLARANPSLTIVNRGRDGARFEAFVSQLDGGERFDAVLVLGGGNDVIRMTSRARLRDSVRRVAQEARLLSDLVVFVPPGNVGNAPFFRAPWTWLMRQRSRMLQVIVAETARANGALHVSLFQERANDPFAQAPERMNAADGLHPSDDGYALWQREIESQVQLSAKLRRIGRASPARDPGA